MMATFIETLVAILILAGAAFLFVGSFGLAKLPDTMRRLHAPTKATTLGIGSLLIASMVFFVVLHGATGIHELLITLFLFLTAPVTANMIAKVHLFRTRGSEQGPPPPQGSQWATFEESAQKRMPSARPPSR